MQLTGLKNSGDGLITRTERFGWAAFFAVFFLLGGCLLFGELNQIRVLLTADPNFLKYHCGDYPPIYTASLLGRRCLFAGVNMYDAALQLRTVNEIISPVHLNVGFVLQYPPQFYLAIAPLSFFGMAASWIPFFTVNVLCLMASVTIICWKQTPHWSAPCILFLLTFCSYSAMLGMLVQTSVMLMLFLMLVWRLMESNRFFLAGLLTAIGIFKIQYLLFVVVCGCCLAPKRFLQGFFCGVFAALVVLTVLYGPTTILQYPHAVLSGESTQFVTPNSMQNLRGLLGGLGVSQPVATGIGVTGMFAGCGALFFVWRRIYPSLRQQEPMAFLLCASVSLLMMPLVSLHSYLYDYVFEAGALYWFWVWLKTRPQNLRLRMQRAFLLTVPLYTWGQPLMNGLNPVLFKLIFVVDLIVLLVLLANIRHCMATNGPISHGHPA